MNTLTTPKPAILVELAKDVALAHAGTRKYLPTNGAEAQTFEPHEWVVACMSQSIRMVWETELQELEKLRGLAATVYAGLGGEHNLPEPWLDALNAAANGEPFTTEGLLPYFPEYPEGCTPTDAQVLREANHQLAQELEMAKHRIEDMLKGDDGQAWKEAQKFLDRHASVVNVRHIKTGGLYKVVGAATLQTNVPLEDMVEVTLYQGEDGKVWARHPDEFAERFEAAP